MLTAPLYRKFKNVANPKKFFKKQFIAAALTAFVGTYGAAGAVGYHIYQSEIQNNENFRLQDLFSLNAVRKHGLKGGAMTVLGYAGDISLLYSVAGLAHWRQKRKKEANPPALS